MKIFIFVLITEHYYLAIYEVSQLSNFDSYTNEPSVLSNCQNKKRLPRIDISVNFYIILRHGAKRAHFIYSVVC